MTPFHLSVVTLALIFIMLSILVSFDASTRVNSSGASKQSESTQSLRTSMGHHRSSISVSIYSH